MQTMTKQTTSYSSSFSFSDLELSTIFYVSIDSSDVKTTICTRCNTPSHLTRLFMLMSTVAHNCHIKTKCSQQITNRSHQIQIAHSKFKSLTANSNRSQQITNHSQQITNRSQQIQIAHSKFKSFTTN